MFSILHLADCDYNRKQLEEGIYNWGSDSREILELVKVYEDNGYEIVFKTSLFQRLFGVAKYRIEAHK